VQTDIIGVLLKGLGDLRHLLGNVYFGLQDLFKGQ